MSFHKWFNIALVQKQSPLLTMPLPVEILSQILSFLPKNSLKALRLVCKGLYDVATSSLFSSIFVSARHLDREIADLVAARFSNSIQTLTFSSQPYYGAEWEKELRFALMRKSSECENASLHCKKAELFWNLYSKIGLERQTLYESGAVHGQLCHLLNTLPNLRRIVITDRRRRQDLSWLQEASFSGFRPSLADLHKLRKDNTSTNGYKTTWAFFRSVLKGEDILALAQLHTIQSVGCGCFDKVDEVTLSSWRFSGLGETGTRRMPENPWAVIMTALHKSLNASTHTISIQPKRTNGQLPILALKDCGPGIILSTSTVLARLTKLELRLAHPGSHKKILPVKMLSGACKLRSLTIDIMDDDNATSSPLTHWSQVPKTTITTFESLLAGCKLPHLSTLHLHRVTFLENDFSTFLQHSPELRELSLQGFYMVDGWHRSRPSYPDPRAWERILQTVKETLRYLENFDLSARQLCEGEENDEYSLTVASTMRIRVRMRAFDAMVQRYLFDEGTNPFAEIAV